ncbi:RhoGAP-domain-containing protein [Corynespora cassiicola Philippines]|uniref:RhoGAP-domain-containing protein n=1 Tax=Corynespora cassiicola Philippines TaxID=1448308 RepID=A0A2T2N284_CORCC|nr:RhoGAP-domain-containing protein [Corynespora cassiicola Philippines]
MGTPVEGPPSLEGQGPPPPQLQPPNQHPHPHPHPHPHADPRGNGLSRQPTNPLDMQSSQNLSPHKQPMRSLTDPMQQQDPPALPKPKKSGKICGKCGEGLTGQFVRALGDTYHLECFTCHDCGKIVASKFFPVPEKPPGQYPLCETDYFRRLDLLCFECGQALRGSYITALDRKYHIEHFTCSVCPTVFGASDSYYEHEGSVYCHYHYSTKFAQRCNGCQTSILKQFVEIFRNGQNQHWHPECYMIHKYWNVRLHSAGQPVIDAHLQDADSDATDEVRDTVRKQEETIEAKVNWIWKTLSAFEEKSATCISDMLLHVSNGAYVDGVMAAKKFIVHVELLFMAADSLDAHLATNTPKGLTYSRESKLLCKKVVAFFALLTQSQGTGVRRLGVTQELLSLVTGLAHYLKLLIRICLQGALKLERETRSATGLTNFLKKVNDLDARLEEEAEKDQAAEAALLVPRWADACPICDAQVEDKCLHLNNMSFNYGCLVCRGCGADLRHDVKSAYWSKSKNRIFCPACASAQADAEGGFERVTKLRQYVHLLKVAHARLMATLRSSGALPHTSDDPNLAGYDSTQGHRLGQTGDLEPPHLRQDARSKSFGGSGAAEAPGGSTTAYEQHMTDIKRLRSTRLDKHLSNTMKRARTSRIIDGPTAAEGGVEGLSGGGMHIVQERDGQSDMDNVTLAVNSLALDDIARMAALEQQREQRPNAFRAGGSALLGNDQPKLVNGHRRDLSSGNPLDNLPEGRSRTYFSELSPLEYFKLKGLAVLQLGLLLDDSQYNQGDLLDLIETKRTNFWGKIGFGKAFKGDKTKAKKGNSGVEKPVSERATFRQSLELLVERYGAECTEGVGPGHLKVPALLQDAITAMKSMDMSVEGVFRKNGNLKALRELEEEIDAKGVEQVDLNSKNPVILANLLKRFLRLMPDPVLTLKLYRLFMTANEITDEAQRKKVLHLICCLLPKAHRDTMEVLFCFLNWVSSFHTVDEETGNKMDTWNLATVMAPNILRENNEKEVKNVDQGAVKVVHDLIENNNEFCEVPEEILELLNDDTSPELTTKEIMRQWEQRGKNPMTPGPSTSPRNQAGSASRKDQRNSPHFTHADHNPQAWSSETSVRPMGQGGLNYGPSTTPQGNDLGNPNAPYSQPAPGSTESHRNGSPHRHSYRSPAIQKQTQLGTAGAG